MPTGAYGLDDVLPPRYSPLLINMFGAMPQRPEEARSTLLYTAVEGFTSPEWRRLLQNLENLAYLIVPLSFAMHHTQVVIVSSSNFTKMCPRLK